MGKSLVSKGAVFPSPFGRPEKMKRYRRDSDLSPHGSGKPHHTNPYRGEEQVSISERKKEINARRKRRETLRKMKSELPKADAAKKAVWAAKLRKMTPGAEMLIKEWGLE